MHIMITAQEFLSESDKVAVGEAIKAVEECTSAEVVCAVATESGRYDRAEAIVGLAGALIFLSAAYALRLGASPTDSGDWGGGAALAWLALAVTLGFITGNVVGSYWHSLRRLLTSQAEMDDNLARAAQHIFARARLSCSRSGGGVLIFVSLYERRAIILADAPAAEVLGARGIEDLRDIAIAALRERRRSEVFIETIVEAAARLKGAFPPAEVPANVIGNDLLFFHPRP
ncbi:hypothetical protein CVU37_02575 [candidate division BRC1 bacterium HGW-BRC1-1]|jgi:putative membrane protein|nr:MAG: hypothetical protein CVU37_02575 [candidate division BRC1 bacterium HGW-BRC1-1]